MLFECSTSLRVCCFCCCLTAEISENSDIVEMIKQFPDPRVDCYALSFKGDIVYIGGVRFVTQWNLDTDYCVKLEGYTSLVFLGILFCFKLCIDFKVSFLPSASLLTAL